MTAKEPHSLPFCPLSHFLFSKLTEIDPDLDEMIKSHRNRFSIITTAPNKEQATPSSRMRMDRKLEQVRKFKSTDGDGKSEVGIAVRDGRGGLVADMSYYATRNEKQKDMETIELFREK
jgi:hypothetical protein